MVSWGGRVDVYNMLTLEQEFSAELPDFYTPIGRYLVGPESFAYDADNRRLVAVPPIPGAVRNGGRNGVLFGDSYDGWFWVYPDRRRAVRYAVAEPALRVRGV